MDWKKEFKRIPVKNQNLIFKNNQLIYSDAKIMDSIFSKYCFLVTSQKVIALQKTTASFQAFDLGQMPEKIKKHYYRCKER